MRLLVLGGTQFLGRAIATQAVASGHEVTCAARGITGQVPQGTRLIKIDREAPDGLAPLAHESFDAVVDVARHPGQVRNAIAALRHRTAHWTLISTISVYADNATPNQDESAPLLAPTPPDIAHGTPETYGPAKVACEQATGENAFPPGALIVRAGLIVGPEDPTGRFTYWPTRLARGGEVLVPGPPDDPVQVVDVRDLAAWIVRGAEAGLTGAFNATSPPFPRSQLLAACAAAAGTECTFTWTDRAFLESQDVRRWSGPRSLPLWMPGAEFPGFNTRLITPARNAGLTFRPLADTARDTLHWARQANAATTGLTTDEEATILSAWHARPPLR